MTNEVIEDLYGGAQTVYRFGQSINELAKKVYSKYGKHNTKNSCDRRR